MVIAVVVLVAPIGLAIGCIAGYFGGIVDTVLMRVTDVFLAFPRLILALAFVAALKPGVESAILAIALTAWPCGVCRCITAWASSRAMWIAEWMVKPAGFTG